MIFGTNEGFFARMNTTIPNANGNINMYVNLEWAEVPGL
jgi:hypothetical protein